jgi:hypothetical protein
MTCNVGGLERTVRIFLGIALVAVATVGALPSGMMILLYVIGAVALVTGAIGFCPAWTLLGINTCGVKRET